MKCLIVGASGQVGGQLAQICEEQGIDWHGTACRQLNVGYAPLDIRDPAAVRTLILGVGPSVVFLPAAMTHVDYAEKNPNECWSVNVAGTTSVARVVRELGARLVLFSTDHVFGECDRPMLEDDCVAPQSVYARSKVAAEKRTRDLLPDSHLILRTSWVFGPEQQGKNFVYRAVRTLGGGEHLIVPADQWGQPTYSPDLASAALDLVRFGVTGTFHVVGPTRLTRLAHARLIARLFELDPELIVAPPTSELRQSAPRPLRVWLATEKVQRVLGREPIRSPESALRMLRDTMLHERILSSACL